MLSFGLACAFALIAMHPSVDAQSVDSEFMQALGLEITSATRGSFLIQARMQALSTQISSDTSSCGSCMYTLLHMYPCLWIAHRLRLLTLRSHAADSLAHACLSDGGGRETGQVRLAGLHCSNGRRCPPDP